MRTHSRRFHNGTVVQPTTKSAMPVLTIKGMPDALYKRLKARAAANGRSLNSEIIFCLQDITGRVPPDSAALLKMVDATRNSVKLPFLTEKFLEAAINRGRK
jgi:plasmid stability protein